MTGREVELGGDLLVTSRTADIYDQGDGTVLKLFFAGTTRQEAEDERDLTVLAHGLGATEVECRELVMCEGRYGLIIDKLDGESLTSIMASRLWSLPRLARVLADVHLAMHDLHTAALQDVRELGAGLLDGEDFAFLTQSQREALRERILALPRGDSIVHMDYHTENVFAHRGSFTVIDWSTGARGAAAADVAMTTMLFQDAESFPGASRLMTFLVQTLRTQVYRIYRKEYLARGTVSEKDIERFMVLAYVVRLGTWHVPSERALLQERILEQLERP